MRARALKGLPFLVTQGCIWLGGEAHTLTFLVPTFAIECGLLEAEASMVFLPPQLCLLSLLAAKVSKAWSLQSTQTTLANVGLCWACRGT